MSSQDLEENQQTEVRGRSEEDRVHASDKKTTGNQSLPKAARNISAVSALRHAEPHTRTTATADSRPQHAFKTATRCQVCAGPRKREEVEGPEGDILRSPRCTGNLIHLPSTWYLEAGAASPSAPAPRHEYLGTYLPTDDNSEYLVGLHHIPLPRGPSSAGSRRWLEKSENRPGHT